MVKVLSYYLVMSVLIFSFFYTLAIPKKIDAPEVVNKVDCVSYAPFGKDDSPFNFDKGFIVSEELIDKDLELLSKNFNCIRTYSTTGLESIPKYARKYNLQIYLGAWVSSDVNATQKEIKKLIEIAKDNSDVIKALIVGNEALLRKDVSGEQLISYIKQVRDSVSIPITYADVWEFWLKNREVATVTDFVTIHILPYWEDIPIEVKHTKEHIMSIVSEVKSIFPNKEILIGETGWPSFGRMREEATPSLQNQAEYIRGFLDLAQKEGLKYNLIEAFDQPWKRISEGAVGGYWGLFDKNRLDKNILKGDVSNYPNWKFLSLMAIFILLSTTIFIKNILKLDIKNLNFYIVVAGIGAILFTLQINDYFQSTKNIFEYIWATVVIATLYALYLISLNSMINRDEKFYDLKSNLWFIFITLMLISGLSLMFDGRYREFQSFAFGFGVILYLISIKKTIYPHIEKVAGVLLLISSLFILFNEKYTNIEADIWVAISIIFGYKLLAQTKAINFNFEIFKPYILASVITIPLVLAIRFYILNGVEFVAICEKTPMEFICLLRSILGFVIHFQIFGYIAVIGVILAIFAKSKNQFLHISLIFSIVSIGLYNVSLGAIATIASLYMIAYKASK